MEHVELEAKFSLSEQHIKNNNFSAAKLLVKEITREITYRDAPELYTRLLMLQVEIFRRQGIASEALPIAEELLAIAQNTSDKTLQASTHSFIGNFYAQSSDYPRALEHFQSALLLNELLENKGGIARNLGNLGNVYGSIGDYERALGYMQKALTINQELQNMSSKANNFSSISNVYRNLEDYTRALEFLQKALEINEVLDNKHGIAHTLTNIGGLYTFLKDDQLSLEYMQKALVLYEELGDSSGIAINLGNIGSVYNDLLDFATSYQYYIKAVALNEELGSKIGIAINYANIASLYSTVEFELFNPQKAEEFYLKSIALCREIGAKRNLYNSHESLARLYVQEQRWEEAFREYEQFHTLKEAVQSEEAVEEAERMEYRRKVEESERDRQVKLAHFQEQEKILHNILPSQIADRMIEGEKTIADSHEHVSVFFSDIVGFTKLSQRVSAEELVGMLNGIFTQFDQLARKHGLEKIKTIGDAYMAVCGAPIFLENHAERTAQFALDVAALMNNYQTSSGDKVMIRIGLHTGSVVAGIIGENKFAYDMWGDAVNTASRMESHGEAGKIHVSEEFKHAVETLHATSLQFTDRGELNIKGKGIMKTYFFGDIMNNEQLNSLLEQADELSKTGNFDEAERLANQVLAELEAASDSPESRNQEHSPSIDPKAKQNDGVVTLKCSALLSLAWTSNRKGVFDKMHEQAMNALDLATLHSHADSIHKAWNLLGHYYRSLCSYDKALEFYNKALSAHAELGQNSEVARVIGNIGLVYSEIGFYDKALEFLNMALNSHNELGQKAEVARVTGNIGVVYYELGSFDKALELFKKALSITTELGQKSEVARLTGNIGNVYTDLGFYDKALEYFNKALNAHSELGQKSLVGLVIGNIGIAYKRLGSYDKALEYFTTSLLSASELGDTYFVAYVTGNIGGLYAEKKYDGYDAGKAEEYLLKAIDMFTEIGVKAQLIEQYKDISDLYKQEERWKDFATYFEKYIEIKDEVNVAEAKKQESIREQQKAIEIERTRATAEKNILNNILPEEITQRLIKGENPIADHFDAVSVLFMDIVDFTPLASSITAQQLVHLLNAIFSAADGVMRECGLEKIKTIGDAYMAVAGAPVVQEDHAHRAANAALKLLEVMENLVVTFPENYGDRSWIESIPEINVRIGLHCGPVAAGVVGENKFLYDLWGDAVNTASRMESHGEPGKIHVSEEFKHAIETLHAVETLHATSLQFIRRGAMDIKGKGRMETYFLEKSN